MYVLCRLGAPAEPVLLKFALVLQVHINFVLDQMVFSVHTWRKAHMPFWMSQAFWFMIQIDFHMYMLAYSLMILILSMDRRVFFLAVLCTYRICLDRVVVWCAYRIEVRLGWWACSFRRVHPCLKCAQIIMCKLAFRWKIGMMPNLICKTFM